jgi:hypothetical protein
MIIRKSSIEILETSDEKIQQQLGDDVMEEKLFIESNLLQNEPIWVDENEITYTMAQHGCYDNDDYDDEQKLLEKLIANWDSLSLSEKEVAHCINGTMPKL